MLEILVRTPPYVWILLAVLLWDGVKATKTHTFILKEILVLPIVLLIWSAYSITARYGFYFIYFWLLGIAIGAGLGFLTLRKRALKFDKKTGKIEAQGDYWPIILSMLIFTIKYALGVTYSIYPDIIQTGHCLAPEFLATILSGTFTGRLIAYRHRLKNDPHTDLA